MTSTTKEERKAAAIEEEARLKKEAAEKKMSLQKYIKAENLTVVEKITDKYDYFD